MILGPLLSSPVDKRALDGLQSYRPTTGAIDVPWLMEHPSLPLIDVRAPVEFQKGHIPGAVNIPLFDDDQRAEVGTLYNHKGRETAVQRGLDIATSKADSIATWIAEVTKDSPFVIHCWRGGMRSRGVAWLCDQRGLKPTLLRGGYKAFRRAVHRSFQQPRNIILLAGKTGTGKTLLLEQLAKAGQQTIDLEGLAVHRGSVFGGIPGTEQPSTEQFENRLYLRWRDLDPLSPVWIEGENQTIGRVRVPHTVFQQMIRAPIAMVEVQRDQRIEFLLDQYSTLSDHHLVTSVQKLHKRLGGLRLKQAIDAVESSDRWKFAEITLEYYDKTYGKAFEQRRDNEFYRIPMDRPADPASVGTLINLANKLSRQPSTKLLDPIS